MINSMERELKSGQMEISMKDNTLKGKNKEWACLLGWMEPLTQGIFLKIIFMELEPTFGVMEENTLESGRTISAAEMEFSYGQMDENMKVNTLTIKKKDMEFTYG